MINKQILKQNIYIFEHSMRPSRMSKVATLYSTYYLCVGRTSTGMLICDSTMLRDALVLWLILNSTA